MQYTVLVDLLIEAESEEEAIAKYRKEVQTTEASAFEVDEVDD